MTLYHATLAVDFGEVGFWNEKAPFRIRLDTGPLADLIRATQNAHRVYELLLIDRSGDVWDYVWVVIEELPKRVADRVDRARQAARPRFQDRPHPWPDDRIPLKVFDGLFYWAGDDTEPADEAWLSHRDSTLMRSFARQALSFVRVAQGRLDWNDALLRHVVARVRSGEHPYCYLDRELARTKSRELPPNEDQHPPAFYERLSQLLRDADLVSVAYRADGDYRVLRMLATEQRRRASLTGHEAGNALQLSALVNRTISNEAWESEIWFFSEGLAHGDLFIEGGGLGGGNLKALVEVHQRVPGRFILAARDAGDIAGFTKQSGDGWVLYSNQTPDCRRRALQRIEPRRRLGLGAGLAFARPEATVFGYERAVVVVGVEVPGDVRAALAAAIGSWQGLSGTPVLVVFGETEPFDLAGFKDVMTAPKELGDEAALARWLEAELDRSQPWIDVAVALHAPAWVRQVLADRTGRPGRPWPAWVVATEGEPPLKADLLLDGNLEQILTEAHRRAQRARHAVL